MSRDDSFEDDDFLPTSSSGISSFTEIDLPSPNSQTIRRGSFSTTSTGSQDQEQEQKQESVQDQSVQVTPQVTMTTQAAVVQLTKPRFGDRYGDGTKAVWVGGAPNEDFTDTTLTTFRTPMCLRSEDPSSEMKGYTKRVLEGKRSQV